MSINKKTFANIRLVCSLGYLFAFSGFLLPHSLCRFTTAKGQNFLVLRLVTEVI